METSQFDIGEESATPTSIDASSAAPPLRPPSSSTRGSVDETLPPLGRVSCTAPEDAAVEELEAVDQGGRGGREGGSGGDGGVAAVMSKIRWKSVPNAAFDEVVARIIMDPLHELGRLDSVFIRREADGSTLLHVLAGWAGCAELVEQLLLLGLPPDAPDDSGWTPLLEAAQEGQVQICAVLLACGATPHLALGELTPLRAAAEVGNEEMTRWLLQQPGTWSGAWDASLFADLLEKTPGAVSAYLDRFATVLSHSKRGSVGVRYSQLRSLYGEPHVPVDETVLALVVESDNARDILSHRVIKYLLHAKWNSFARVKFRREVSVYALLLVSYFLPTIWADPDWVMLQTAFDYWVAASRVVSWGCCVYLLITVELNEFRGDSARNYFFSFWNLLNIVTYASILASIPIELHGSELQDLRNSVLALISVSLWVNLLQFLQVSTESGLLIAMMSHMVKDVYRFLMLYAVFVCGYSGAFYLLLRGQSGYESFTNAFITVFLMLFGAIDYSVFTDKALQGWRWHMGNVMLLTHLVSVVIVLLNILIAMMATTYSDVWDAAEAEALQSHAQAILRMEKSLGQSERMTKFQALLVLPPPQSVAPVKHRKPAPSIDKNTELIAASSKDVVHSRLTAKRDITQGVLSKLKALPVASDERNGVSRSFDTKNEDSSVESAGLATLEDGIRYEASKKKKAKEDEQLAAMKELQLRVEQLTKALVEMQRHNESSSSSWMSRKLQRTSAMGDDGLQYTTSLYKRP